LEFLETLKHYGINDANLNEINITGSFNKLSIIEAEIELLQQCEFACRYCIINGSPLGNKGLEYKKQYKIIKWLIKNNLRRCTLTGGDPLLYKDFWKILDFLLNHNIKVSIYTTGALINDITIKKFLSYKNKDSISFQISIDNSDKKLNDLYRGIGAFDTAIRAIETLRNAGFNVTISSIIYRKPIETIRGMVELAEKYGAKIKFGQLDLVGRAANLKKEDVILSDEEYREMNNYLARLGLEKPDLFEGRLASIGDNYYKNFIYSNSKQMCPSAFGSIDIRFDGVIKPCSMPKEFFDMIDPDYASLNALEEPDLASSKMYEKLINAKLDNELYNKNYEYHCTLFKYKMNKRG